MADDWRTADTEALLDAILRLEDRDEAARFFRDLCTLGELHDMAQRWAVVRLLDAGMHYAEISPRDRRQHGDDHPDRLVAQPRRGRLPRGARPARARPARPASPTPSGASAMSDRLRLAIPNKGRLVEPTLQPAPRRGPRLRGARPEPRRARPELRPRHPLRPDERRHRVRRRRRRRPRHHRRRPARRDRRRAAAAPLARLRPLPARGRRPDRRAVPDRSRTSPACASRPPTRTPPGGSSRSAASRSTSSRSRAPSRSRPRLGLAEAIVDLVSTGSTLVMNGLRPIGDVLESEAVLVANPTAHRQRADDIAAIDTMLSAVIAARGRKYLMMNAPAAHAGRPRGAPAGPRVAVGHPARPRGHDRDPLRRRRGRGLGPPAAAQGRRRIGHPRPADREDRPVTASRAAGRDAVHASAASTSPPADAVDRRDDPSASCRRARGPGPGRPRRRPGDPRRRPRSAATAAVREASAAFGGGPADGRLVIERSRAREPRADRCRPTSATALEQAIANVRRFAETQRPASTHVDDRAGHRVERRWLPLAPRRLLRPGRRRAVPVVARHDRRPGPRRGRRARSSSRRRPARTGASTRSCSAPAGLLGVDALLVAGGAQAIGALAFGLPDAGVEPVDRIVGPGNAWVTAAKLEVSADRRDRPAGRAVRGDGPRRRARPIRSSSPPTSSPRPSTAPTRRRSSSRPTRPSPTPSRPRSRALLPRLERAAILAAALRDHGWIVLAPDLDAAIAFVNEYAPEHLSVDVADPEARRRPAPQRRLDLRRPVGAGVRRRLRDRREPRPADRRPGPIVAARSSVEAFGRCIQVQRIDRDGPRAHRRPRSGRWRRPRA